MVKKYIEITVKEIRQIPIEDVIYDGIEFFKLLGFIEKCHEHDLQSGPSQESIDAYNETVIEIEELAQKYGLYDEYKSMSDDWYDMYTLWPKMEEFFKENIIYK